ncbi:MAG TPA: hypothetical protein PLB90_14730 [Opitutaceae bacterium]|nr:hypothetical protein [Opitutaceae bacterium]
MNASARTAVLHAEELTESEHFALELRWYEGKMLPYAEWVTEFAQRHHGEIRALTGGSLDPAALLGATKELIAQRGSLHMVAELRDQQQEIQNELWYRGEQGEHDRRGIQQAWAEKHASAWRQWRVKEYLFVANRCAAQVVSILLAPAATTRAG